MFRIALAGLWKSWRRALVQVHPDTVVRWQRQRFRRYWAQLSSKPRRKVGRPSIGTPIRNLIQNMARANSLWRAPRIHGELLKLGIKISERTVSRILRTVKRPPSQSWKTFLQNHLGEIVATDVFTVPTVRMRVLFMFIVLEHQRRKVLHFGVTQHPTSEWVGQHDKITDAIPKMIIYTEVEKLRCARKIVAYKAANPGITLDDTVYHEFITKQGAGIDAKHLTLWPAKTPGQAQKIDHWSGLDLRSRALKIGDLFVQIYDVQQPQWSWQVHSGITGIVNLKAETFSAIAGSCLKSCADFHKEILAAISEEFHLDKHDHKISGKLEGSYWMALARDQQEAEQILRYHTG